MGSAGTFFSALSDRAREHAEEQNKKTESEKAEQRQIYADILKSPNASREQRDYAVQQLNKLYNMPKGKSPFEKVGMLLNVVGEKLKGSKASGQPPAGEASQAPPASLPKLPSGPRNVESMGGDGGAPQPAPPEAPKAAPVHESVLRKVGKGLGAGLSGTGKALEAVGGVFNPPAKQLPPLVPSAFPDPGSGKGKKIDAYIGADGKKHEVFQAPSGHVYEEILGEAKPTGSARPVLGRPVTLTSAMELSQNTGAKYLDADGKEMDLSQIPEGMALVPIFAQGKQFWQPFDPNQKVVTVGGVEYAVSPMEISSLTKGGGTELGPSKTASTRVPGYTGVGEGGKIQRVPGTTTPSTPGVRGRGAAASLPPLAGAPTAGKTAATGAGGAGRRAAAAGKPDKADLPLPAGMYNQQLQVARPVRAAAIQLFGDPENPDFKSLVDYAPMADDQHAQQAVGTATRAMLEDLTKVENQHGGLTGLLLNYGGLPELVANIESENTRSILAKLTPEERNLLDQEIAAYGSIIGLRSLTKASAAQFSSKSIERELPLLGYNVNDSKEFLNKISKLAEEVATGTRGLSRLALPERDFYLDKAKQLSGMVNPPKKKPAASSTPNKPVKDSLGLY